MKILYWQSRYEKYHVCYGGDEEERKANYSDMVREGQVNYPLKIDLHVFPADKLFLSVSFSLYLALENF
jgi:hypothetical protein